MKKIISKLIKDAGTKNVLILGDIMLDEYIFGTVSRISPEAPVPVVKRDRSEWCLGGAANVVANCKHIGLNVSLVGIINASDEAGKKVTEWLNNIRIPLNGLVFSQMRPTTNKVRIIAGNQQCVRLDKEDSSVLSDKELKEIIYKFEKNCKPNSVILLSDYAKGVVNESVVSHVISFAKKNNCIVIVDPKGMKFDKYKSVNCIKPNLSEFKQMLCYFELSQDDDVIVESGREVCRLLGLDKLIITMGEKGIHYISIDEDVFLPAYKKEVYNLSGAGDTVISFLALCFSHDLSISDTLRLSNKAASITISHVKTYAVSLEELLDQGESHEKKIYHDWARLKIELDWLRLDEKLVVFTNGCFDLLHSGHVFLLNEAKKRGAILVVGLNSDESIKRLNKGLERPINNLEERCGVIASLGVVDFVTVFDQDTPKKIIEYLRPNILVKGGDYAKEQVVGYDYMMRTGGEVYIVNLVPEKSTTKTIKKVIKMELLSV
jgi:D-beta-D-heptose 7-phosphate kinase / D-beta-D-heptose 1-phosphate adenosyltransferase